MYRTFYEIALEKFSDAIKRHHLEVEFYDSTSRWISLVLANETRAITFDFEPPDGYLDLRFGSIPKREPGTKQGWESTRSFSSLRKILLDRGVDLPAGEEVHTPDQIAVVLESFALEADRLESFVFGRTN